MGTRLEALRATVNLNVRRGQFRDLQRTAPQYGFTVADDGTVTDTADRRNSGPLVTARASVETESEIRKRITATRVLVVGPLGLLLKKKTKHTDVFLTVTGEGFEFAAGPLKHDEKDARKLAHLVNTVGADWSEYGNPLADPA